MIQTNLQHIQKIYSLIDLTSLNENDTEETIAALCQKANSALGHVAAVCIYPQFISLVKQLLGKNSSIKIATVSNFPEAKTPLAFVLKEIIFALNEGADEIDIVMPYHDYLSGKKEEAKNFIAACKKACGNKLLKVILETGALQKPEIIRQVSMDMILSGADFIKTSTGKIAVNATPLAAEIMLTVIRDLKQNRAVGFKAAGGIRTIEQAEVYIHLAEKIMGPNWISPNTFRIGASRLIDELFHCH